MRLFPDAVVTVEDGEMETYLKVLPPDQLLPHPPLGGLAAIRNWLLDTYDHDVLVMADDDLLHVRALVGWRSRTFKDPRVAWRPNSSRPAPAVRATRVRRSSPFNHLVGGTLTGVIGDPGFRYDLEALSVEDVDATLQSLMKQRVTWVDHRFVFVYRHNQAGGDETARAQKWEKGWTHLQEKWGSHVARGKQGVLVKVARTA